MKVVNQLEPGTAAPPVDFGRGKLKRIIFMASVFSLLVGVTFAQAGPNKTPAATAPIATANNANATTIDESKLAITDNTSSQAAAAPGAAFGVWDLVRMLIILGLVVASIYGVFYVIRRGSKAKPSESNLIRVLGSQGLPGKSWVHVVTVQKQVFLIGGGDANLSLIAEITDQESIDELKLQAANAPVNHPVNFADLMGGFFGTGGKGTTAKSGSLDFMKRQRDRLKKFKE